LKGQKILKRQAHFYVVTVVPSTTPFKVVVTVATTFYKISQAFFKQSLPVFGKNYSQTIWTLQLDFNWNTAIHTTG